MVDAALNIAAEQVIEHSAYGALLTRTGNRGPCAAPQNLYQAAGTDRRAATTSGWRSPSPTTTSGRALRAALGDPAWAADPALATAAGRVAGHDAIDEHLAAWCREPPGRRDRRHAVGCRRAGRQGDPAARAARPRAAAAPRVLRGARPPRDRTVAATPRSRSGSSRGPDRFHRRAAPLLGEHNDELLARASDSTVAEIEALEAAGIIGRSLPGG